MGSRSSRYDGKHPRLQGIRDTAQSLVLIADALGIPIETLRTTGQINDAMGLSLSENAELIRAFEQIKDADVRRRVISYVQGEANRAKDIAKVVVPSFWEQPGS